jgi:hypothetical protein
MVHLTCFGERNVNTAACGSFCVRCKRKLVFEVVESIRESKCGSFN